MRDYDPTIDTIERWGEEMFKHILETGEVDDWTGTPAMNEGTSLSLRKTIADQGTQIETLLIQNEDLKSENDKLRALNNRARLACILFGSAVVLILVGTLI